MSPKAQLMIHYPKVEFLKDEIVKDTRNIGKMNRIEDIFLSMQVWFNYDKRI